MPEVGFEPTIPVFERAKTVHALDSAAGHCDRLAIQSVALNNLGRCQNQNKSSSTPLSGFQTVRCLFDNGQTTSNQTTATVLRLSVGHGRLQITLPEWLALY
jgi:hypothetical protein